MNKQIIFWGGLYVACCTMIIWLMLSVVASGFRVAYVSCDIDETYPIEYVLYTDMFCPIKEVSDE